MSALGSVASLSVAFSGGVDSSVLLEALRRLHVKLNLPAPRALHVDHGLEPCSARWAVHCEQVCDGLGLEFLALHADARVASGQSPEEVARVVRYRALREAMTAGEVLCVAHHADDQAETSLLQMLRGAGVLGGGGMRVERDFQPGRLCRPMLSLRRRDIMACAKSWGLSWVEDPANHRRRHPRNRLRAEALPLLQDIAPGAVAGLTRAAQLQREAADAVNELARLDCLRCRGVESGALSRAALAALPSSARRRAVLRLWLDQYVRMPSYRRLSEIERQICSARHDGAPCVEVGALRIELHGDAVLLFESAPPLAAADDVYEWIPAHGELRLPHGRLWARQCVGAGLLGDAPLTVRMRRGGERCKPEGRARSQTLKRLLQFEHVPAWRRKGLPLLYRDDELIAVADLWICAGHAAHGVQKGWLVQWQPDRQPMSTAVPC